MGWQSFVALGDSFTEGLDDPYPDGTYRGWADLVAASLAARRPGFRYANLAVRGRQMRQVTSDQVPVAMDLRPDLVSLCAGVNDILRPRVDLTHVARDLDAAVARLRAVGSDVLLFVGVDPSSRSWFLRRLRQRVLVLNRCVREVSERHGALLVDLWGIDAFDHPSLWSADRLHLAAPGHRTVAAAVLGVLGETVDGHVADDLPLASPLPWLQARRADLEWARAHLAPWMVRRLRGRSSGDGYVPKRPGLECL